VRYAFGLMLLAGCASTGPRLSWVSSQATQATWSLVVDDGNHGGTLWVDGRPREDNCGRVRSQIRCELRGLWPGGHQLELRVAGAVLRRTVLIGHPWPERLAIVRVTSPEEAEAAGKAGADAVLVSGGETRSIVTAAHAASTRALVWWDATAIDWAGADGIVTGTIPPALHARFPEARVFAEPPEPTTTAAAALALLDGNTVVPAGSLGFLRERKRHKALQRGKMVAAKDDSPQRRVIDVADNGHDSVRLYLNLDSQPWTVPNRMLPLAPGELTVDVSAQSHEGSAGIISY